MCENGFPILTRRTITRLTRSQIPPDRPLVPNAWSAAAAGPMTRPSYVFFFQAEDGIRDYKVTGVQTCALPICRALRPRQQAPLEVPPRDIDGGQLVLQRAERMIAAVYHVQDAGHGGQRRARV